MIELFNGLFSADKFVEVYVLPHKNCPRLLFTGDGSHDRWMYSSFYPAFKKSAKLYRLYLRAKATIGAIDTMKVKLNDNEIKKYLSGVVDNYSSISVLVGTPGPAQKITIQIWNEGKVLAYIKYAENKVAIEKLNQEHKILSNELVRGIGPKTYKYDNLMEGKALLISPVKGSQIPAKLNRVNNLDETLNYLLTKEYFHVDNHPWIIRLSKNYEDIINPLLVHLSQKKWHKTIIHGDFAPWNIFIDDYNMLSVIDWEYGDLNGFPYIDKAYFILQTSMLVKNWKPSKAKNHAIKILSNELTHKESYAIVMLAALMGYDNAKHDGHDDNSVHQLWRKSILYKE